jgi:thiamine biosynthesis lipoprotein
MHRKAFKINIEQPQYLLHRSVIGLLCILVICTALISGCERPAKQYNYSIFTFGTLVDITLYSDDKKLADEAFEQLQENFDDYHQQWSPWTDGDLGQLNRQLADIKPVSENL